jgi:N-acetylmuramoyl-L-alanine amidase
MGGTENLKWLSRECVNDFFRFDFTPTLPYPATASLRKRSPVRAASVYPKGCPALPHVGCAAGDFRGDKDFPPGDRMNSIGLHERLNRVTMLGRVALSSLAFCALSFAALADGPVVVIDPGHPSSPRDPGLKGKKLTEVQVNYRVAAMLVDLLSQQGVTASLTKPDIRLMLTNKRRAEIANWAKADLFVRIHCDETKGSGYTIVFPGAPGQAEDGTKGPSQHVINASSAAAKKFHDAMAASLKAELTDNGVKTDAQTAVGAKQGALTGSIYSKVPTFLVDLAVLGNPHDEAWLLNRKNVPKLVKALDKGVLAALGLNPA